MKAQGKKAKGSRLERKVAELIRLYGLDKSAKRMPLSGADWALKSDIYTKLPWHIEVKNQEKVRIWEWYDQAEYQHSMSKTPMVVFSSNFRPIMITLKFEDFLSLLKDK